MSVNNPRGLAAIVLLMLSVSHARKSDTIEFIGHKLNAGLRRLGVATFSFTEKSYKAYMPERTLGTVYAVPDKKMGIQLGPALGNGTVKFKIVKGDDQNHFEAMAERVGDFIFLRIGQQDKRGRRLNREHEDTFPLQIRASYRRRHAHNMQTRTQVLLIITDENDLVPFFDKKEYSVTIPDHLAPFSEILTVKAKDADAPGLNSEIYYSFEVPKSSLSSTGSSDFQFLDRPLLLDRPPFTIDPNTGVIRTLRPLSSAGNSRFPRIKGSVSYELTVYSRDRADILFNQNHDSMKLVHTSAKVTISVIPSESRPPRATLTSIGSEIAWLSPSAEIIDAEKPFQNQVVANIRLTEPEFGQINRVNVTCRQNIEFLIRRSANRTSSIAGLWELVQTRPLKLDDAAVAPMAIVNVSLTIFFGPVFSTADRRRKDRIVTHTFSLPVSESFYSQGDYLPPFQNASFHFVINERIPVDSLVGLLAPPELSVSQAPFTYSLVPPVKGKGESEGKLAPPFRISAQTGAVYVNDYLDFERSTQHRFSVEASSRSWNRKLITSLAQITIDLEDANDHDPVFTVPELDLTIDQATPIQAILATVKATDGDSGPGGRVTYSVAVAHPPSHPFVLDAFSGDIKLRQVPDPTGPATFLLQIRASDWGQPLRRESQLPVRIRIDGLFTDGPLLAKPQEWKSEILAPENENRHNPLFDKTAMHETIFVPENQELGATVLQLEATDYDFGYNGLVLYAIAAGNEESRFQIDWETGRLSLLRPLDYELNPNPEGIPPNRRTYSLVISAIDAGRPSRASNLTLAISVTDVNDNSPRFLRPKYSVSIREDVELGTELVALKALDPDEGPNGKINYAFAPSFLSSALSIDHESGVVRVAGPLDRELEPVLVLRVDAVDGGAVPRSGRAELEIRVRDVNDNQPFCPNVQIFGGGLSMAHARVSVPEDFPQGALLTCLSVVDEDEGRNGDVTYSLSASSHDMPFQVEPMSGCLFLLSPLDYETNQAYNVSVHIRDSGDPSLGGVCFVWVEVADVNENRFPPKFLDADGVSEIYVTEATVKENEKIGTLVTRLNSVDEDDASGDPTPMYSIVGGSGMGMFSIDDDGSIKTVWVLDRETQNSYWLTVLATDRAPVPLSSTLYVYIRVGDVNDHAPWPTGPVFFAEVPEHSQPNVFITHIQADDLDESGESSLSYAITRGNPQSFFQIEEKTGYLKTHSRQLDREIQAEHELEVTIYDNGQPGLSSTAVAVVTVTDVNDHDPQFRQRIYNFNVPAINASVAAEDMMLFRIFATDDDIGFNADLAYRILDSSDEGLFQINETTGSVHATGPLLPGKRADLTIEVSDCAGDADQGRRNQTRVILSVADFPERVGNAPPIIIAPLPDQPLSIFDEDTAGHTVGILEAMDPDADPLWFSITGGNVNDLFALRKDNGYLELAKRLPQPLRRIEYQLSFEVTDGVNVATGTVIVKVMGSRLTRPVFPRSEYELSVAEDAPFGTVVGEIAASVSAPTTGGSAPITYSLESAEYASSLDKFSIDPREGTVRLTGSLDREVNHQHVFTVAAKQHPFVNYAYLKITVADANDHAPVFSRQIYLATILDSAEVDSRVALVIALDWDAGGFGTIGYEIVKGNEAGYLAIGVESGLVSLAKPLPRTPFELVLEIRATDGGGLFALTTLKVVVQHDGVGGNGNGGAMKFSRRAYEGVIDENALPGRYVLSVGVDSTSPVLYGLKSRIAGGKHRDEKMPFVKGTAMFSSGKKDRLVPFRINALNGDVFVSGGLDFHTQPVINLSATATNTQGKVVRAPVTIRLRNVNDHSPRFTKPIWEGWIDEGAPVGTVIVDGDGKPLELMAVDGDSLDAVGGALKNGHTPEPAFRYRIMDTWASGIFKIGPSTGVIQSKEILDYESKMEYRFSVGVNDAGAPPLSAETDAVILVHVRDRNDVAPRFESAVYDSEIWLPTAEGVEVVRLRATDSDSFGESQLTYSFVEKHRNLKIDSKTGIVTVARDIVNIESFGGLKQEVQIKVSDGLLTDLASVRISVRQSESGGSLQFGQEEFRVSVLEGSNKAQTIALLETYGSRLGEHVMYRLLNEQELFSIDPVSGALGTNGIPLDREERQERVLVVEARDQTRPVPQRAQTLVRVNVTDVNDNAPVFYEQPYFATVISTTPLEQQIGAVMARDADAGDNGDVVYTILENQPNFKHFRIDPTSGLLKLKAQFPKKMHGQSFNLTIVASDKGSPKRSSSASVLVQIVDAAVPVFSQPWFGAQVRLNATVGSVVLHPVAHGPSTGHVTYYAVVPDAQSMFGVDPVSGFVFVRRKLVAGTHHLRLRAVDVISGLHSDVPVDLKVEPDQVQELRLIQNIFETAISEGAAVGSPIVNISLAPELNLTPGTSLHFRLIGPEAELFNINPSNGAIFLKYALDFEKHQFHRFNVSVENQFGKSAIGRLTIAVLDVNDNAPYFQKLSYDAVVNLDGNFDDKTFGKFVGMASGSDPDKGDRDRLKYEIVGGNEKGLFAINEKTGEIRVKPDKAAFDSKFYLLNISLSDGFATAHCTFNVRLVTSSSNGEFRFKSDKIVFTVFENSEAALPRNRVGALETEGGQPPIVIEFGSESAITSLFNLQPTGELLAATWLDAESHRDSLRFPVFATDASGARAWAGVEVRVNNANDHGPHFYAAEHRISVPANIPTGTRVFEAVTSDLDTQDVVEYSLEVPDGGWTEALGLLHMDRTTGHLTVKNSLKKIAGKVYNLLIRATDSGNPPLRAQVPLQLHVSPPAQPVPKFSKSVFKFAIPEDAPLDSFIGNLTISKGRGIKKRDLDWSIVPPSAEGEEIGFRVDNRGGIYLVELLDHEEIKKHVFFVEGKVKNSQLNVVSQVRVEVTVEDVNDNVPQFVRPSFAPTVSECAPKGTNIFQFTASDPDSGSFGQVSYALETSVTSKMSIGELSKYFDFNPATGLLVVNGELDREKCATFEFRVRVRDGAADDYSKSQVSLTGTADVMLTLTDCNDNAPSMVGLTSGRSSGEEEMVQIEVPEDVHPGTVVRSLRAVDPDAPPHNSTLFVLVGGNERGLFGLRETGDLFLVEPLDYESAPEHPLTVLVTDGVHSSRASVLVLVLDANDNEPVCNEVIGMATIPENTELNEVVLELSAADKDASDKLTFQLEGTDLFGVTETGQIIVSHALDYEIAPSHDFAWRAVDKAGHFCETVVRIHVSDVNDEPPVFSLAGSHYEGALHENLANRTFVVMVNAKDPDLGPGGIVKYSLAGSPNDDFSVDEWTGAVVAVRSLDREQKSMHNLSVVASDMGQPELSSSVLVAIRVLDINDNAPKWTQELYEAEIWENATVGSVVKNVRALGLDEGDSGKVVYSLLKSAPRKGKSEGVELPFQISEDSGIILLSGLLDSEVQTEWLLTVAAADRGTPPLTSTAQVAVRVRDVNDNSPVFAMTSYDVTVMEDTDVGTEIVKVAATDADVSAAFSKIVYALHADAPRMAAALEYLRIDKSNGAVTLVKEVDREKVTKLELMVHAWNPGFDDRKSETRLSVVVGDVNDNPPMFADCNMSAVVQETFRKGDTVYTLGVTDPDGPGHAGPFSYQLTGPGRDAFKITKDGRLVLAEKLQFKTLRYSLKIKATDAGTPPLGTDCPISILVIEESKHPPVLLPTSAKIWTYLGEFPGGRLATAHATDLDPMDQMTYSLNLRSHQRDLFAIDPVSGNITAMAGLRLGQYLLNVSVTDGKFVSDGIFSVQVESITEEMLDFSVSLVIGGGITPTKFVADYLNTFRSTVAAILTTGPDSVKIMGIQQTGQGNILGQSGGRHGGRVRKKRDSASDTLDVLLAVEKKRSSGYYKKKFIKRRLDIRTQDFLSRTGLKLLNVTMEACSVGMCAPRGVCMEQLLVDDIDVISVSVPGKAAFVSPPHLRTFMCSCRVGFGGRECEMPINDCSTSPCADPQICVPDVRGYECVCSNGGMGPRCEKEPCETATCDTDHAVHFDGRAYLRHSLQNPIRSRIRFAVDLRTKAPSGVVMFAAGQMDYNVLEIRNGFLTYRLDCGSGEAVVTIDDFQIADGQWHNVQLRRRGTEVTVILDGKFKRTVTSPGGNSVINFPNNYMYLGAQVHEYVSPEKQTEILSGFVGCLNRISLDEYPLALAGPDMTMFGVDFRCEASFLAGACASEPCYNKGTCIAVQGNAFSCVCHNRFKGTQCELDMNPCASAPCAAGSTCENTYNDFFCRCPPGLTGKICSIQGDFDECISSPCGHGSCQNVPGSFLCTCERGWSGPLCYERDESSSGTGTGSGDDGSGGGGRSFADIETGLWGLTLLDVIGVGGGLILLILIACCIVCICRCRNRRKRRNSKWKSDAAAMANPAGQPRNELEELMPPQPGSRVGKRDSGLDPSMVGAVGMGGCEVVYSFPANNARPPPLPPRRFGPGRASKLSNLDSCLSSGLPTVQVRPLSFTERQDEDAVDSPLMGQRHQPMPTNLVDCAQNYGSAAEQLETCSQVSVTDMMRTFGKPVGAAGRFNRPTPIEMERSRTPPGMEMESCMQYAQSLEAIKQAIKDQEDYDNSRGDKNSTGGDAGPDGNLLNEFPSNATVDCLPENQSYNQQGNSSWRYGWMSTLGRPTGAESDLESSDGEGGNSGLRGMGVEGPPTSAPSKIGRSKKRGCGPTGLPYGVSQLEETDSEQIPGYESSENEDEGGDGVSYDPGKVPPPIPGHGQLLISKLTSGGLNSTIGFDLDDCIAMDEGSAEEDVVPLVPEHPLLPSRGQPSFPPQKVNLADPDTKARPYFKNAAGESNASNQHLPKVPRHGTT